MKNLRSWMNENNSDQYVKTDESTRLLSVTPLDGASRFVLLDVDNSSSNNISPTESLANRNISWRLGILLAIISGILFTASNFLIQYFKVEALEVLLVRSVIQSVVMGFSLWTCFAVGRFKTSETSVTSQTSLTSQTSITSPPHEQSNPAQGLHWTIKLYVVLQALLGAIRLYLNFECLSYLPLGDALTLIFTEPLFTMLFSCVAINFRFGLFKIALCFGLLSGMVLCVQPPLLFTKVTPLLGIENMTIFNGTDFSKELTSIQYTSDYYTGASLALGCALCGSLCNILIKKSVGVSSSQLVFFAGIFGIFVSIAGCFFDQDGNRIVSNFESMEVLDWLILVCIALVGIFAYFTMTVSLKLVSPTSVSVLRAMEILLAYLCQILVMGQMPNATCIGGAVLVMASVVGIAIEEKMYSEA